MLGKPTSKPAKAAQESALAAVDQTRQQTRRPQAAASAAQRPDTSRTRYPERQDLPLCTAMAYRRGRLIRQGQPHEHEYINNAEDTRYLYQDFAGL